MIITTITLTQILQLRTLAKALLVLIDFGELVLLRHEGVEVLQVSWILVSYKTLTAYFKAGQFAIVFGKV